MNYIYGIVYGLTEYLTISVSSPSIHWHANFMCKNGMKSEKLYEISAVDGLDPCCVIYTQTDKPQI